MFANPTREERPFDQDAATNGGYLYTTNAPLSSRIANDRHGAAIFDLVDLTGRRVVDIGCGDGTYTIDLYDRGRPREVVGLDAAAGAIAIAQGRVGDRACAFVAESAYAIPYPDDHFDIAHIRGLLHHLDRPAEALREALRVARTLVVLEPNGYNPMLKGIERLSRYHRAHGERSYAPHRLDRWIGELGGRIDRRDYACLVPFFCPDWLARALKAVEPLVEATPVVRRFGCGVYVFVASRRES